MPIRYVYYDNEIIDFGSGVNSTIRMLPYLSQSSQGTSIDKDGSLMYLSRKVSKSTVAQLYIMNDPFNKYPGLELVHKEPDQVVEILKMQNAIPQEEDLINYRGTRGAIKIWEAKNIPEDIKVNEEFTQRDPYGDDWKFGMLDELEFRE